MRNWLRKVRVLLGIIFISGIFVFMGAHAVFAKDVIKIGASISLSGKMTREGNGLKQGYEFWANFVNEKGGIEVGGKMYSVELVLYDDESNPQRAAKLTEKLISQDKVDIILGPYSSTISIATSAISEKYGLPTILPLANSDKIYERGYRYAFGLLAVASKDMVPMVDICLKQTPKPTKLAIITANSAYPLMVANGVKKYAEKLGLKVVYFEKFPDDTSDISAMLTPIKRENPDILLEAGYFEHSMLVNRNLKGLKWVPKALAYSVGPQLPEFSETLGKDAEGAMAVGYWHYALEYKDPTFGSAGKYAEEMKEKFGQYPIHIQAYGTATGLLLERAIGKADSLNNQKVRDALSTIEIKDSIVGPIKFDEKGRNIWGSTCVLQVQGKKNVIVYPEHAANAKFLYPLVPWGQR